MRLIYKIAACAAILASLSSCEEFQPVFTGKYPSPDYQEPVKMEATHTIAELVGMYEKGKPLEIAEDIVIAGKVSTTDQPGNIYKSLYIQDETGGIELKIGKNGLYNDYKPGQTLYVKCNGLTLGQYGYKDNPTYGGAGMVQLGFKSKDPKYETSYMELSMIVDSHIFKGELGEPLVPKVIEEGDLPGRFDTQVQNPNVGSLVTLKGLKYGNEIFALLYVDSNKDKDAADNRIFLSDHKTWNVTTWAMSKSKMAEHLLAGDFDAAEIGSGSASFGTVGDRKGDGTYPDIDRNAYSVSQYFKMGNTPVQIRTSGYSKFSDKEIDKDVLAGTKSIDVTGILTMYQGSIQFVLLDIDGVKVN